MRVQPLFHCVERCYWLGEGTSWTINVDLLLKILYHLQTAQRLFVWGTSLCNGTVWHKHLASVTNFTAVDNLRERFVTDVWGRTFLRRVHTDTPRQENSIFGFFKTFSYQTRVMPITTITTLTMAVIPTAEAGYPRCERELTHVSQVVQVKRALRHEIDDPPLIPTFNAVWHVSK